MCAQRGELYTALRSGVLITRDVYAEPDRPEVSMLSRHMRPALLLPPKRALSAVCSHMPEFAWRRWQKGSAGCVC